MILNYFRGAVRELHNITWPTRRQATLSAIGVLIFVVIAAALLGGLDYLLSIGFGELRSLSITN